MWTDDTSRPHAVWSRTYRRMDFWAFQGKHPNQQAAEQAADAFVEKHPKTEVVVLPCGIEPEVGMKT